MQTQAAPTRARTLLSSCFVLGRDGICFFDQQTNLLIIHPWVVFFTTKTAGSLSRRGINRGFDVTIDWPEFSLLDWQGFGLEIAKQQFEWYM